MPGVVIGRFQEHRLHDGHKWLIVEALQHYFNVLIIIGCRPVDRRNPLPFDFVKEMILETFHAFKDRLIIISQDDIDDDDDEWYRQVESKIDEHLDCEGVRLYASRDSVIKKYRGKYSPVTEIQPKFSVSASKIREEISKINTSNEDFRAGIIWAVMNILNKGE
jgi:nicotinamide mononucleotide adenylyltransferase